MPQMNDRKKPYVRLFPLMATRRGTSPTHARIEKWVVGNESTRKEDERRARQKFLK
jgi:hypothetical protein